MELQDILEKTPAELTDEEKDFVKANKDKLTDDQKGAFKDVLAEDESEEGGGNEGGEEGGNEGGEGEGGSEEESSGEEGGEEKVAGSESAIISKDVLKTLERNASEGVRAMAELRKQKIEGWVSGMVFSESNQAGPLLPKSKDKVVNFMSTLTEAQQGKFKEVLGELPKGKMFSELGKDSGVQVKASEQVNNLVSEKMKADSSVEYRHALEQVFAENPELAEAARNE